MLKLYQNRSTAPPSVAVLRNIPSFPSLLCYDCKYLVYSWTLDKCGKLQRPASFSSDWSTLNVIDRQVEPITVSSIEKQIETRGHLFK